MEHSHLSGWAVSFWKKSCFYLLQSASSRLVSDTDSSVSSDEAAVMVKTTAQDRDMRISIGAYMAQKEECSGEGARHAHFAHGCNGKISNVHL